MAASEKVWLIERAGRPVKAPSRISVALPQLADRTAPKRLPHVVRYRFEGRHRGRGARGPRATDATGRRPRLQLPGLSHLDVLRQRCRPFAAVRQVLDAGPQTHAKLSKLLMRRTNDRLLINRYASQTLRALKATREVPQAISIACCVGLRRGAVVQEPAVGRMARLFSEG